MEKCSKCKRDAVIYLAYANVHQCEIHFCRMFEKRFFATIRDTCKIKRNERVAVGLSGGKDSTVMLYLLDKLKQKLPFELIAITIDEGIKGYRNESLEIAKKTVKDMKIEHRIFTFKKEVGKTLDQIMERKKGIPCSYCGVSRRYLLNKTAREVKADKLAIGHNLDDIAQTTFMNIMRNEPLRLIRYLNPKESDDKFVPRIKPLIRCPEKEVAIYAILKGINIHSQECPYAHFAFRQQIRHHINELEERYPGIKFKILNSFLALQKYVDRAAIPNEHELKKCSKCGEPTSANVCKFCEIVESVN